MMVIIRQVAAVLATAVIFASCGMGVSVEGGTRESATTLIENTWADGSITPERAEQWFKFTATAGTHYLHIGFGTLTHLYVQVYDNRDNKVGDRIYFGGSGSGYTALTVTSGKVYYIKVTPYSGNGAYRIAFNAMPYPPLSSGVLAAATTLVENAWTAGALTASNTEQWFKFTATAGTHYLHVLFGNLSDLYIQLYDRNGSALGSNTYLDSSDTYKLLTVAMGQVYYVRVWRESGIGTYRITFSASATAPAAN
jgi:heme/copper-type cytochrome/quinol oxidase subunit 3